MARTKYRLRRMLNEGNGSQGGDLWQVAAPDEKSTPGATQPASAPELTKAEIEKLKAEAANRADEAAALRQLVDRLKAEFEETVARNRADFDNLRKRSAKDKEQVRDAVQEEMAAELLPVLDNFERAIESTRGATDPAAIRAGVEMVAAQLRRTLEARGLKAIDAAGQPFDPNFHDALSVEETTDIPDGHVTEVLVPGYTLGDKVIRPAMVKVAKAPGR